MSGFAGFWIGLGLWFGMNEIASAIKEFAYRYEQAHKQR